MCHYIHSIHSLDELLEDWKLGDDCDYDVAVDYLDEEIELIVERLDEIRTLSTESNILIAYLYPREDSI